MPNFHGLLAGCKKPCLPGLGCMVWGMPVNFSDVCKVPIGQDDSVGVDSLTPSSPAVTPPLKGRHSECGSAGRRGRRPLRIMPTPVSGGAPSTARHPERSRGILALPMLLKSSVMRRSLRRAGGYTGGSCRPYKGWEVHGTMRRNRPLHLKFVSARKQQLSFVHKKERTADAIRSFICFTWPYTSSITAISAASPRRGPVRVTLV